MSCASDDCNPATSLHCIEGVAVPYALDRPQDRESYADVIIVSGHVTNKHLRKECGQTILLFSVVLKMDALCCQTITMLHPSSPYPIIAEPLQALRTLTSWKMWALTREYLI